MTQRLGNNRIQDGAVTGNKIADSAINSNNIVNGAITSEKIAPGAGGNPAAFDTANSAFIHANSAFVFANGSAIAANTPSHTANSSASYANAAFIHANSAFAAANSAGGADQFARNTANAAFIHANSAFAAANSAGGADQFARNTANAAFAAANSKGSGTVTSVSGTGTASGLSLSGTVTTSGSITLSGTVNSLATGSNYQVNSLGVGTAASGTAGEIRATNNITAYYSDKRLKKNIKIIDSPIEKIKAISGVYYNSNEIAEKYGYTDTSEQVGVLAQDVQNILPHAVKLAPFDTIFDEKGNQYSKTGENYLTVQYEKIIPLLIECIKDQQNQIEQLRSRINNE